MELSRLPRGPMAASGPGRHRAHWQNGHGDDHGGDPHGESPVDSGQTRLGRGPILPLAPRVAFDRAFKFTTVTVAGL